MPNRFAFSPSRIMYVVSGHDPVMRWDGYNASAEPAGVLPPAAAPALAFSVAGTITGSYAAFVRFVDQYGNVSDLSPSSPLATAAANGLVTYTGLAVPTESKVVRRQVLRNTAGQFRTFYVDIDTTDLTSASLTSTLTDTILQAGEAVVLVSGQGLDLANLHAVPPDFYQYATWFQNRLFMCGVAVYAEGNVRVVPGQTLAVGIGTDWRTAYQGRYLHVDGADAPYLIVSIDPDTQQMTLSRAYTGPLDNYAQYAIKPADAYSRVLAYSEAGLADSWPVTNAMSIPEDNDEITGLVAMGGYLYILCRHHIYSLSYQDDPAADGGIFGRAARGAVNDRCWVVVQDTAYVLDESGVFTFTATGAGDPISVPIQGMIRGDNPLRRINWECQRYFHASYFPDEQVIRWFVTMGGGYLPRSALCLHIPSSRWWVESFPARVGASCLARAGTVPGKWQEPKRLNYLGLNQNRVVVYPDGNSDGPRPVVGVPLAGDVLAGSPLAIRLGGGVKDDMAGWPIDVVAGPAKGTRAMVEGSGDHNVTLVQPLRVLPDADSAYRVGGIQYRWQSGWLKCVDVDGDEGRQVDVVFRVMDTAGTTADLDVYENRSARPELMGWLRQGPSANAISTAPGEAAAVIALDDPIGTAKLALTGRGESYTRAVKYISISLNGVSPSERQIFFEFVVWGVYPGAGLGG